MVPYIFAIDCMAESEGDPLGNSESEFRRRTVWFAEGAVTTVAGGLLVSASTTSNLRVIPKWLQKELKLVPTECRDPASATCRTVFIKYWAQY